MALHTITLSTTAIGTLTSVQFSRAMADADVAAIDQLIADDQNIVSSSFGPNSTTLQAGVIIQANTTTTLTTMTSVTLSSPASVTISSVQPGMYVYGTGITPGTVVTSASGTTINISAAPTTGNANGNYIITQRRMSGNFSKNGLLNVPNRGTLQILPGDYIFVDPSGWPVLLSKEAVAYQGSPWIFT